MEQRNTTAPGLRKRLLRRIERAFARKSDSKGTAAIEFAFIASILSVALLNVVDFARYFYAQMQVNEAAEVAAQAAWSACDLNNLPASTTCTGFSNAVNTAVQSTSLGTSVTLQANSPSDAWYCVNTSGSLQNVATIAAGEPSDCTAAGVPSNTPGEYIEVQVTYTWAPLFPGLSVASQLPATMTSNSWMRLQ